MKHRSHLVVLVTVLCALAFATGSFAQDRDDHRDDNRDDHGNGRFALALGAGVVEPDNSGEIYYHAALRIRVSHEDERRGKDDWRYASRGDIQAHIEPELGYWSRDDRGSSESDLLVGVNAVGVIPGRAVDYFFGVGLGVHFLDTQVDAAPNRAAIDESDSHFGGNFQVGLDVHISRAVSLFGTGRFDAVEGLDETVQGKVYMGLRFRF